MNRLILTILVMLSFNQAWSSECASERKQLREDVTRIESAGEKEMKSLLHELTAKKNGATVTANYFDMLSSNPMFVELQNARVSTATEFLRTLKTDDCKVILPALKKMKVAVEKQWELSNKALRALLKAAD